MSTIAATHSVPIERQEWIIDVSQVSEPAQWPECCIYRVPKKLRKVNKDAYTPKLISIGPLHHRRKELRDMENLKVRYFKLYCNRALKGEEDGASTANAEEKEVQLQKFLAKIVEDNSEKIRHCYAERPRLDHKEFVSMVLVDATFIIELFLRAFGDAEDPENDYILSKPWLWHDIEQDLILLENQLPFFILEEIYDKTFSKYVKKEKTNFLKIAGSYLTRKSSYDKISGLKKVEHLTDLRRYLFIPPHKRNVPGEGNHPNSTSNKPVGRNRNLPSASNLDRAGVEFKMIQGELLDIKFKKCPSLERIPCLNCSWLLACLPCCKCFPFLARMEPSLEVPQFVIDDSTETVFRNLMALEQCHYPLEAYICNYMVLLDQLIDTEKDVDLLVSKEIIENNLGNRDAVATMINKLCVEIGVANSQYCDLSIQLSEFYEKFWNHTMATLKRVYFADIWTGTKTVVGLIVLGFTLWGFIRPYFSH